MTPDRADGPVDVQAEILAIEAKIVELNQKLVTLRKASHGHEVSNYTFRTQAGEVTLRDLFGDRDRLLVIHNMGEGCRYCTLWADGFSGLLPHLESTMGVVLVSKDDPETQRRFANARGWRFRLASHGGGDYIREQACQEGAGNMPGAVVYERDGDRITRKNACVFGPGDLYCSMWSLLGLAGLDEADWTPQYAYWRRPAELEDGGHNVVD